MKECYDAVIVGARYGGSPLAVELARGGWDVLLIDRDEFPSDTLSTNGIWPSGVARLEALGALDLLRERHRLHPGGQRWRVLDHEISGDYTPVGGHRLGFAVRRVVLDLALLDTALAVGAKARLGEPVKRLIGAGTATDPVRGVVMDGGEEIEARWVIGADGRASTVAGALGLAKVEPMRGEMAFMFAYWRGLPDTAFAHFHAEEDAVLTWGHCEDDVHMVILSCRPRWSVTPATSSTPPPLRASAMRSSRLITSPRACLARIPPWSGTESGATDAPQSTTSGRSNFARFPRPETANPIFAALESDEQAAEDFRDVFTRRIDPRSELFTPERLERWFAAAAR